MNDDNGVSQTQQISSDDISAHLADQYQFDTADKAGDVEILSDNDTAKQTDNTNSNEMQPISAVVEQSVSAPTESQVSLTMNDVASMNDLRDTLTQSYYQQQIDANKQALDGFLRNPDTGEEWSVEELTGDDGSDGYVNKATGRVFTDAEAVNFIQSNRFNYQQSLANFQANSSKIASLMTNASIDAKYVQGKYGSILEQNPALANQLDQSYRKIVKMSDDGKFILDAPISMREFYDMALANVGQPKSTPQDGAQATKSQDTGTSPAQAQTPATSDQNSDFGVVDRTKAMDDALDDDRSPSGTPDIKAPAKGDLATQIENELMKSYKEHKQRLSGV